MNLHLLRINKSKAIYDTISEYYETETNPII